MVRLGVVGAGIWGATHVQAYAQHPSAELAAICDLDEERARKLAAKYGNPKVFTDLEKMLDEGLDGISVATPDAAHTAIALKAAERGVHILVEKPLATTVEECRSMIAAAQKSGVLLMVDWHNRWNPSYYEAWKSIRSGDLGEVRYIYFRLSDTVFVPLKMLPWASKSSVMWFLGSHSFDTICWLLQKKPVRIYCQKRQGMLAGLGVDTPDFYVTMMEFEGGAVAVVENSWILPQESPALIDNKCEILGTKGAFYIDPTHNGCVAHYSNKTRHGFPDPVHPFIFGTEVFGKQMGFGVESIYHFVDCIRDGKIPLATGEDGLLNTKLILLAEQSAKLGMPVSVE